MPHAAALNALYTQAGEGPTATKQEDELLALLLALAAQVHSGNSPLNGPEGEASPELQALYAALNEHLAAGVAVGLGEDFPDLEFRYALARNVSSFSAAKTVWELMSINALLPSPATGQPRPWVEFREEVLKFHQTANVVWLRTEYDTAVARSQGAAKWQRTWADREALPWVEYRTVRDSRVRDSHVSLDRITLPVAHPFWQTYWPPNGWGCRCTVSQRATGEATPPDRLATLDLPPPLFRDNPGTSRVVFRPEHPYFAYAPQAAPLLK